MQQLGRDELLAWEARLLEEEVAQAVFGESVGEERSDVRGVIRVWMRFEAVDRTQVKTLPRLHHEAGAGDVKEGGISAYS